MVSRILRANTILSLSILALICAFGLSAKAQTAKKSKKAAKPAATAEKSAGEKTPANSPRPTKTGDGEDEISNHGEVLKFNTDSAPVSTDRHEMMQFKDPGAAPVGTPRQEYADSAPEDSGFKAYLGYPKYIIGLYAAPMNVASQWTAGGSSSGQYNFTSGATALGGNFRLLVSPIWNIELDYHQFSMSMTGDVVSGYRFHDSTASFGNYYIRNKFCLIGKSTFFQQLCPGLDIANDGYPIVNYTGSTDLELTRVQDILIGLNLTYQIPVGRAILLRLIGGYNYGTGIGNSGYLTSKNNSSYFGEAALDWNITEHFLILAAANYKARQATVSGTKGSTRDTWTTDSSTLGGRIGLGYQF